MGCLAELQLVGLRDVCGDDLITPSTAYYLNDLPGLEIGSIAAGNQEAVNAKQLIERQMALAQNLILDTVRSELGKRWQVKSLLESRTTGLYRGTQSAQAAQAFRVGQYFKSPVNQHAELFIESASLLVNYTGTVTVKAWDVNTGEELHAKDFDVSAGEVSTQSLGWAIPANGQRLRVFVGYDATSVPTWQSWISHTGCHKCKGGFHDFNYVGVYSRKVPTSDPVQEANLRAQTGTSGLSLTWGLNCTVDRAICSMGYVLAPAVLFKAGELLARQMKFSKRLSPEVLYFRGDYDELSEDYRTDYERHYQSALDNAVIPQGDCFKCTSAVKMRKTG